MLILASGSPRRRELLTQIGVAYMVNPSTYNEESPKKKDPEKYVQAQALGKARDVAEKFPGQWVLGADTIVAIDGPPIIGQETFRLYGHRADQGPQGIHEGRRNEGLVPAAQ